MHHAAAAKHHLHTQRSSTEYNMDPTYTFQRQALEIREPGGDFDPTTMPQSGEEYLMHMLYERQRCPAVVVLRPTKVQSIEVNENSAAVDEERMKYTPPASLRPTPEWKTVQAANFEETRERINFMRQQLNEHNYDNALEPPLITDAAEWRTFCCNNPPLLSTILRLNQRTLENVLELFSDWLSCDEQQDEDIAEMALDEKTAQAGKTKQEEKTTPEETMELDEETEQENKTKQEKENAVQDQELIQESQPTTSSSAPSATAATSTSNANTLDLACSDQWLGSWLYAVLTCLHLPIEPNVHSTLREIARSCMRLRSNLLPQELDKAVPYNLFIYIIAQVFDQLDFTEFV